MELIFAELEARALRRARRFRDRLDPLALSDAELLRKYRFPRNELIQLIHELDPLLQRRTARMHAIPTHTQVLMALRVYASGSFQHVIGDTAGPTQASVSRVFTRVTNVLSNKAVQEIHMPSTPQAMAAAAQAFSRVHNYPRVVGAIDCTHVAIKGPSVDEVAYVNRKRYHSLNVQAVCDADGTFINYSAQYPADAVLEENDTKVITTDAKLAFDSPILFPIKTVPFIMSLPAGATHDAFIWGHSSLRAHFLRGDFGDYLLLGDSGYPLERFLMTPVRNPVTPAEERHNRAHTGTRVIVEQAFGVLKNRFRCLHSSGGALQYTPLRCAKIIAACILLHNRCVRLRILAPAEYMCNIVESPSFPSKMQRKKFLWTQQVMKEGLAELLVPRSSKNFSSVNMQLQITDNGIMAPHL